MTVCFCHVTYANSTALSHISWVFYWSGTNSSASGLSSTALSHIPGALYRSGTYLIAEGLLLRVIYYTFLESYTDQEHILFYNGNYQ